MFQLQLSFVYIILVLVIANPVNNPLFTGIDLNLPLLYSVNKKKPNLGLLK